MKKVNYNLTAALFLFLSIYTNAQYETVQNGDWNDPSTWGSNSVPRNVLLNPSNTNDSIIIKHQVTFNNGGIEAQYLVKFKFEITQNAHLIIDSSETFATAQASPSDFPTFYNNGNIIVNMGGSFATNIGSATYPIVYYNHEVLCHSNSTFSSVAGEYFEVNNSLNFKSQTDVQIGVIDGNAVNNASVLLDASVLFNFTIGNTGTLSNNGTITGIADSIFCNMVCSQGAIYNNGTIDIPLGNILFSIDDTLGGLSDGFINNGEVIANDVTITGQNRPYQLYFNDSSIVTTSAISINGATFFGKGYFCSTIQVILNNCDMNGDLDLCGQLFGTINIASSIATSVTMCQQGPCGSTVVDEITGIPQTILAYPNPCKEKITLTWESNANNVNINVVDITGKVIYSQSDILGNEETINTSRWSKGVYFIRVNDGEKVQSSKIIKG